MRPTKVDARSVRPLDVRDGIETPCDLGDPLGLEHAEHLIEVLVDMGALVERHVLVVSDDPFDMNATEGSTHGRHLLVDPLLLVLELALGLASGEKSA